MILAKLAAIAVLGSSPFSLTMAPVKMAAQPGGQYRVIVVDEGKTLPATVTMSLHEAVRDARGICVVSKAPVHWATVSPTAFTLHPHVLKYVRVAIDGKAAAGPHDLAIEATSLVTAHSANGKSSAVLHAELISQALLTFPGKVSAHAAKPCLTLKPPTAQSFPTALVAGIALAAVLLALAVVIVLRRRRMRLA